MTDGGRKWDKSVPLTYRDKWDNRDKFELSHPLPRQTCDSGRARSEAGGLVGEGGTGDPPKRGLPVPPAASADGCRPAFSCPEIQREFGVEPAKPQPVGRVA